MTSLKNVLLAFSITWVITPALAQQKPSASVDQKIEALISQMTIEEKAGQLNIVVGETINTGPTMHTAESKKFDEQIRAGKLTGLFNVYGAAYTKRLQKIAVEESRLHIPLLFGADIIHGFKTVTPIPLGEAASWDLDLIRRSAQMAAREATSAGINLNFAPMMDISRDPRWGRISEGAGEDTYLGSRIAEARVKGFQGDKLSDPATMAACLKHFAAYGAAEAGRDYNTADISERVLQEIYLPPFKAAIDAGAATVMPSFNELDGVPATANRHLLQDILRKQWNFNGAVISDYGAVGEMINHGSSADGSKAVIHSLEAGTDMDMMSYLYISKIPELVKTGSLDVKYVDAAVRRILKLKFDLGLFDNAYLYSDEVREKKEVRSKENIALAREVARKSMVLLKNDNGLLPLRSSYKKIAVIGPLADNKEDMNGSWSFFGEAAHPVSVLEGIKARVPASTEVVYHPGCNLFDNSRDKMTEAMTMAHGADLTLLVVGESAVMNGEAASRADIGLPGVQEDLVKMISKSGKPVVVVLLNGRPLTMEWLDQNVPAILETWTLGSEAGNAVADVLFGDYNPSGKLPVTFPRHVGQIPIYYNHKNTGRPYNGTNNEPASDRVYVSKYRDIKNTPLYPFGYGLSYTTFTYSEVTLNKTTMKNGEQIEATVTVTNNGNYDGEEVVQLYLHDLVGSVTRPVKELKGFQKVMIRKGEAKKIIFTITDKELTFLRGDMTWGTEPGMFEVLVGTNSDAVKKKSFELVK